jgi:hypothetical protein
MIHLHDAVRSLHNDAVTVIGNDVDSLVVLNANNETIAINTANVTAQLVTLQTEYEAQEEAKAAAANTAISKLTALGLTADEIAALRGL